MARLFPLPSVALFPHAVAPLHIFEPRYREMLEDALAGDRLLALAVLCPGYEKDYAGRPPIHRMACLGRVAQYERLIDGRFNILLHGAARVRIVRELPPRRLFREAEVAAVADCYPSDQAVLESLSRRLLQAAVACTRRRQPHLAQHAEPFYAQQLPLGRLADVAASLLLHNSGQRLLLLDEARVARRAERLIEWLRADAHETPAEEGRRFPPKFSEN